jgi:gluconolactonase
MALSTAALDPTRCALIIQDLQNDTITPGGAFADGGSAAHARSQDVVVNVQRLAAEARRVGTQVIHVWMIQNADAAGLKLNAPLFRALKEQAASQRGTWGAAPVDGLEPAPGDLVVEKMRMNAFHGTNLATVLEGLGIETLVITGAWTNMSIEHTARHGADAGYRVVVVSDGTSTLDDEWQRAALDYALTNIGEVATVDEVVAGLTRRAVP